MKIFNTITLSLVLSTTALGQPVPAAEENIPYLVTFGQRAITSWGDDDHVQVFFFVIPENYRQPFFIRVFDPETAGKADELKGPADTKTTFSIYGGRGTISTPEARKTDPAGDYKSGNLLATKSFTNELDYDQQWYTFGPLNPSEGELMREYGGLVFKVIAEGVSGDDGNLYRYFMSTHYDRNIPVEGGNAFTFEYTFRMHDDANQVSHIYPFIDKKVISVKQANFDFDNDGMIRMVSVSRKGEMIKISGENDWAISEHVVTDEERGNSLDLQFIKNRSRPAFNNNVVFYITNQYGEYLPFYTIPIGGIPKYKYKVGVRPSEGGEQ